MRLIFLFLFLASSLIATDYNGEIYTWGYAETIKNILDSIRMLVAKDGLATIFKAALGIAFLIFAFKKAIDSKSSPAMEFGKMMLLATAIWYLFLNAPNDAKHRYVITDKVTGEQYVVEQVPTGIGEPLQLITELEDRIIAAMEKTFSLPNSITYRNSGFGYPLSEQVVIARLVTPDVYFQRTFNDFIKNCTIYEISDGSKDITQIVSANNLLASLDPLGDSRLSNIYTASNPDGDTKQCDDVYKYIVDYINNKELDRQIKIASALLHTKENVFLNRTNAIPQLFFDTAQNARNYLQQNFLINMFKKSLAAVANESGLSGDQLAYADAITKQFAQTQFSESGILAAKYLPIIKGVMLALIVALSWIMALLAVMFMDFRYIKMYFILLLWIMLWSPILVIINYIGDMFVAKIFHSITSHSGQALTLFTANKVFDTASSTLAWLGYLIWLVPPLAYAIAQASERGFVSLASSLAQTASQPARAGASADTALAQNPTPSIRVGDEIFRSLPGGVSSQHLAYAYGHNFDVNSIQTNNGATTISAHAQGTDARASATFKGDNLLGSSFSSSNYSANVGNNLVSQQAQSVKELQSHAQTAANRFSSSLNSNITNAVNSGASVNINSGNATSADSRIAYSQSIANSASEAFKHNKDFQKYADKIEKAAGTGKLGVNIKRIAGGGYEYTFSDGKGDKWTVSASESEAKQFNEAFSKNFTNALSHSEYAKEDFSKVIHSSDSKAFTQSASEVYEMADTFSKLKSAEDVLSYIKSNSTSISSNILNRLFADEVKEFKQRGYSNEGAVENAMANIDDLAKKGELMQAIEKRGYLDEVLNKAKGVNESANTFKNEINSKINSSKTADIVKNANTHTAQEIREGQGITNNAVNKNMTSQKEIAQKYKESSFNKETNNHIGKLSSNDKNLNNVNNVVNDNLAHRFYEDNKDSILLSEVAAGAYISGRLFGGLEAGLAGKTAAALIDGSPLNPTKLGDDGIYSYEGFKKEDNILSSDKVELIIKDEDGNLKGVETNIKWSDWKNYLENNPQARAIAGNFSNNNMLISPIEIQGFEKPEQLINYMQKRTEPVIENDIPQTDSSNNNLSNTNNNTDGDIGNNNSQIESIHNKQDLDRDFNIKVKNNSAEKDVNYFNHKMFDRAEDILGNQTKAPFNKEHIEDYINDFKKDTSDYFDKSNNNPSSYIP
jgi:conjugal transfer mating pair stabilization protein TraG